MDWKQLCFISSDDEDSMFRRGQCQIVFDAASVDVITDGRRSSQPQDSTFDANLKIYRVRGCQAPDEV